ncbi:unnamed protein product [Arabidopsis halleri]
MNHGNEELAPKSPSLWNRLTPKQKQKVKTSLFCFFMLIIVVGTIVYVFYATEKKSREDQQRIQNYVPDIILPSMDFTVLKWDLVIRIPPDLPGYFMCLKGYFQTFILYKGVTIANSSLERLHFFLYSFFFLNDLTSLLTYFCFFFMFDQLQSDTRLGSVA